MASFNDLWYEYLPLLAVNNYKCAFSEVHNCKLSGEENHQINQEQKWVRKLWKLFFLFPTINMG